MAEDAPSGPLMLGVGFVLVSFALNSAVTRWIVADERLDPGITTGVRFLAGAIVLGLIHGMRQRGQTPWPGRRNLVPVFWLAAYAFLISYGYVFIGAAAGTFVFYACVLLTMMTGGAILSHRRPPNRSLIGGTIALLGLALLTLTDVADVTPLGVLLLGGTGIAWGAYSLIGRTRSDPLRFTTENFLLLGVLLVLPTAVLTVGPTGTPDITTAGVVAAILMGGITTAISYAVWYWALGRLDAGQAGTYQLAIPILTAVIGITWLDETPTLRLGLSGLLVLTGMALATPRRPARIPGPAEDGATKRTGASERAR